MNEISMKQLEANRQNAKLGGVKTDEGKAVSKYNALKHGLLCQEILLKDESEEALLELEKNMRSELKPKTEIERLLVDRIVANTWRLKRALKGEKEMIEHDIEDIFVAVKNFGSALSCDFANHDSYGKFTRYEASLERGMYKALHELQRIQATRAGEKLPAPIAIDIDVAKD